MASRYTSAIEVELANMRTVHGSWVDGNPAWSLRELFSTADHDIASYCADFRPSSLGEQACAEVERWCRSWGIWIEIGGAHYNSMTPFLHPGAISLDRLTVIGLFNAILFWLNDTVGREKFGLLSTEQQWRARMERDRLCDLLESGVGVGQRSALELATADFLARLDAHSVDPGWLDRFLETTLEHLRTAIRDQNARARRDLLTVDEYIDLRSQVSGMYPAILLCEFGRDAYLDHETLVSLGLDEDLRRLRMLTAEIGALMNDIFSFEKECIVDRSDFNLIPVYLLNNLPATLGEAIEMSAALVRDRLTEFRRLRSELLACCDRIGSDRTGVAEALRAHLDDLDGCVQATWVWQLSTPRYKGSSIFVENNISAGNDRCG